jgi:DNA-binding IclR family transcriptional regulator
MTQHTSGLVRDLEVLELLGSDFAWRKGGLGVQQIADVLSRDKGQISRVCQTLMNAGLIDRDWPTKRYSLGHHLYALAMRTHEAHLAVLARPTLMDLMARAQESAHLTVLRGGMIMTIRTEMAQHPERDDSLDGISLPALRTASGRAILATFSPDELASWWDAHGVAKPRPARAAGAHHNTQELERLLPGPGTVRSLRKLSTTVKAVRAKGYAISDGELTENIVDAAAPLLNEQGVAIGAVAVGARKSRIVDGYQALGLLVKHAAESLSWELGWRPSNLD